MLHSETNFFHSSRCQIYIFSCESTLLKVFEVFLHSQHDFYHISPLPIGFKGRPKRADQQVWACFNQLYLETNTVNVPACQTNLLHKNTGKITSLVR